MHLLEATSGTTSNASAKSNLIMQPDPTMAIGSQHTYNDDITEDNHDKLPNHLHVRRLCQV